MKPAFSLFLKTGTTCNAGCVSCPAGRREHDEGGCMTSETLERILRYVEQQATIISVQHHLYNEPTLNVYAGELVGVCHRHGLHCLMSTNGWSWKHLQPVLEQGLTNLIFSVSGWTNEVHQRSHKGIDIEKVKETMRLTSEFLRGRKNFFGGKSFVRVSWHDYAYNEHELPLMKQFAESLGFCFTPYAASVLPLQVAQELLVRRLDLPADHPAERDLRVLMKDAAIMCHYRRHWPCINHHVLTVDSLGRLHNCCGKTGEANARGSLFDTDLRTFAHYRRTEDPDCQYCMRHGHHIYTMMQYCEPLSLRNDLCKAAEGIWKRWGLGGLLPSVSAWIAKTNYERP